MLFFLHLKARIVCSWPPALIKEIFTRGWFSHDPVSASAVGHQIRFTSDSGSLTFPLVHDIKVMRCAGLLD